VTLQTPAKATPNRDRWGRPLIAPPEGGKPLAYTRVTTLAKTLEEQSALAAWKQRMTLVGASLRPDIVLSAAAHRDDKHQLNTLAERAMEAAQAGAKATIGTALHAITETIDRGGDPGIIPAEYVPDIQAYRQATTGLSVLHAEQFVVLDDIQVAGTTDLVVRVDCDLIAKVAGSTVNLRGRTVIGDKKTGSIEYAGLSIAAQLACYAQGVAYDVETSTRDRGVLENVDDEFGIVVHLPAGQGQCSIYVVDLIAGWNAVIQSVVVRDLRKHKGWMTQAEVRPGTGTGDPAPAAVAPAAPVTAAVPVAAPVPSENELADWIARATAPEHLAQLWQMYGPAFTPELNELAAAKHALITCGIDSIPA
jgi:hypothetical protein